MTLRACLAASGLLALTACISTPYQEMGLMGGVRAVPISSDTVQITGLGNAYTPPERIEQYVLRKAADTTIERGFDYFAIGISKDTSLKSSFSTASARGNLHSAFAWGSGFQLISPRSTVLVRMYKGPVPSPLPDGTFDARDVVAHLQVK